MIVSFEGLFVFRWLNYWPSIKDKHKKERRIVDVYQGQKSQGFRRREVPHLWELASSLGEWDWR
jgi:hypothetical protein